MVISSLWILYSITLYCFIFLLFFLHSVFFLFFTYLSNVAHFYLMHVILSAQCILSSMYIYNIRVHIHSLFSLIFSTCFFIKYKFTSYSSDVKYLLLFNMMHMSYTFAFLLHLNSIYYFTFKHYVYFTLMWCTLCFLFIYIFVFLLHIYLQYFYHNILFFIYLLLHINIVQFFIFYGFNCYVFYFTYRRCIFYFFLIFFYFTFRWIIILTYLLL